MTAPDPATLIGLANKVAATHIPGGLSFSFGFLGEPHVQVMGKGALDYLLSLPGSDDMTTEPHSLGVSRCTVTVTGVPFYTLVADGEVPA